MFDLEKSIRLWRKRVQATGNVEDGEVEELESHLRDAIESLRSKGSTEARAFEQAIREIGPIPELAMEHGFSHERKAWQTMRIILPGLLVNYLKLAFRGLARNQSYNWINILGLSVGLTSALFIAYYTLFELSYDTGYAGTQLYRIVNERTDGGVSSKDAGGPLALGPALKEDFPEVKQTVRLWRAYLPTIKRDEKIFQERNFLFADSNVLKLFRFALVNGQPEHAFDLPNSILISQTMAVKYFSNEDPVGKVLEYDGYPGDKRSFIITGVFKDLPANTHFSFDFLASFQALSDFQASWGSFKPLWTYVELSPLASTADLENKFLAFAEKYVPERRKNQNIRFLLEPVSSIHLHSGSNRPMKPGGNVALIRILGLTGALILLMSCANFIHMSLARAMVRLKETGVRKVLGATRSQLLVQSLSDVLVSLCISLALACLMAYLLVPVFEEITQIPFLFAFMVRAEFVAILVSLLLLIIALTGYLPASFVWGLSAIDSLRRRLSSSRHKPIDLNRILIGFQFLISGALILSLLVVNDQLRFIRDLDVGVKLDNIMAIPFSENPDVFENRIQALEGVESVAYSQRLPVNTLNYDGRPIRIPGKPEALQVESCFITSTFLETYGISLLTGRNLNSNSLADSNKFLINETAMKMLGWNHQDVIGQPVEWSDRISGEVVGVVRDFQLESVHSPIPPMILLTALDKDGFQRNFISIKLHGTEEGSTREEIRKIWRELNPQTAYYEVSMPESYEQLHRSDLLFGKLIFWFTSIALFISVIGLYATASFAAERRRKEIGVRKVLGATIGGIFLRLLKPFLGTAIVTSLLAVPLVVYLLNRWLETFAYHTTIQPATLVTGIAVVLAMTVLSTLKVTLGAAFLDPVKYLRDE